MFGRADFTTGAGPQSVVLGDFNGDGKQDLAVANQTDGTVSILLGRPDATFSAKVDVVVGASPVHVVTGDFNGDGRLDLAVVNHGSNSVSVLLGNGDGTFQAAVEYRTGAAPVWASAGDFNGDGELDLAVANSADNTVSVLLGNGDGTFRARVDYPVGAQPSSVSAADFNGDGKLDLAVANSNCASAPCGPGSVSILLGQGDGAFQNRVDYPTGAGPRALAAGDFNGDGKPDLVVANSIDFTLSVLLGKGDGTFQARHDYAAGGGPAWVIAADFNHDGKLDAAISNETDDTVSILLGNGDGTFQARVDAVAGSGPRGIAATDFNGDGILDLAVANSQANTVSVLLGAGDGTLEYLKQYPLQPGAAIAVTAGDFNGDGNLDLAVASQYCDGICSAGPVSVLLGNGNGTFETPVDYPTGSGPVAVTTGDFNRDGKPDLALANEFGDSVSVLLGKGDGAFRPHADYQADLTALSIVTGDFNADGVPDLAVANGSSRSVSVLLGNGDGTFQSAVGYSTGGNTYAYSVATGDFTGVGGSDLTVATEVGASVLLNSPVAALFPTALVFGSQAVGAASASQAVTLSNPSSEPLHITSIVASGDYTVMDTCGGGLAVGAHCTISVRFAPSAAGTPSAAETRMGAITLTDSSPGSPHKVSLTGTAFFNGPEATLSPASLSFASQLVGNSSAPETVTLSNAGNTTLNIAAMAMSGDFDQTSNLRECAGGGGELHDQRDVYADNRRPEDRRPEDHRQRGRPANGDPDRDRGYSVQPFSREPYVQ